MTGLPILTLDRTIYHLQIVLYIHLRRPLLRSHSLQMSHCRPPSQRLPSCCFVCAMWSAPLSHSSCGVRSRCQPSG